MTEVSPDEEAAFDRGTSGMKLTVIVERPDDRPDLLQQLQPEAPTHVLTIDARVESLLSSGRVYHALCILNCVCREDGFGESNQQKPGLVVTGLSIGLK